MKKSLILVLVFVLCAAFTLAACGSPSTEESSSAPAESSSAAPAESSSEAPSESASEAASSSEAADAGDGETKTLGLICIDLNLPFYVNMMEAGTEAGEDYGVETIWKSAEGNIDTEIALIDGFIEQGVDCILVDPIDVVALEPAIERAYQAGIPTVTMGNVVEGTKNVNTIYPDHDNMYAVGELLGNWVDGEGQVALMVGTPGNYVSDTRQAGFEDAMKEFPNIDYQVLVSNYDANTGLQATQDAMASTPDLKAFACVTDNVTIASMQALGDDVTVFSHDGDLQAIDYVKDGTFQCTVLTGDKRVGYWNVVVGAMLANGEEVPTEVFLPTYWVVSDEAQKLIDEKGIGEGMSIVSADEAIEKYNGYREEFAPGNYTIA